MRRQRGFAELWLIAGIATGALIVVSGAFTAGYLKGKASQFAVDDPLIKAAEAEKNLAVEANKGLQADLARVRADVDTCNAGVAELKTQSDERVAEMNRIRAEFDSKRRSYADAMKRFEAAAKPTTPVPADQQCAKAREALMDLSDTMKAIDALGLNIPATAPQPTLRITPPAKPAERPSLLRRMFPAGQQ